MSDKIDPVQLFLLFLLFVFLVVPYWMKRNINNDTYTEKRELTVDEKYIPDFYTTHHHYLQPHHNKY